MTKYELTSCDLDTLIHELRGAGHLKRLGIMGEIREECIESLRKVCILSDFPSEHT